LAEPSFDRVAFNERLRTQRLGRTLLVRAETASTNDDAWDAALAGVPDGAVVVADDQTRGRGRGDRVWHQAPGRGLALSVVLHAGCDRAGLSTAPLVAGLALVRALDACGVATDLKWPNDVLARGKKLAGILCETRRDADGEDVVVIGAGVNVLQSRDEFPDELRERATSVALEGGVASREAVAAGFLDALEPLWDEHQEGDAAAALEAWRARARFWGERVTVRTPAGEVTGVAYGLAADGGLLLRTDSGAEVTIVTGDVVPAGAPATT
jgi:BirA family biotin operon repressor/biotin-[acetyl-CoA-carboxylase] ligase